MSAADIAQALKAEGKRQKGRLAQGSITHEQYGPRGAGAPRALPLPNRRSWPTRGKCSRVHVRRAAAEELNAGTVELRHPLAPLALDQLPGSGIHFEDIAGDQLAVEYRAVNYSKGFGWTSEEERQAAHEHAAARAARMRGEVPA